MSVRHNERIVDRAKWLRHTMTDQERRLWYTFLRDHPVRMRRQHVIGPYIVDFYCAAARLVIELDGSQHYSPEGSARDAERDRYLAAKGIRVLRVSNTDVNLHFDSVCEAIEDAVAGCH